MGNMDQLVKIDALIETLTQNLPEKSRDTYDTDALKTCTFIPFFDAIKP